MSQPDQPDPQLLEAVATRTLETIEDFVDDRASDAYDQGFNDGYGAGAARCVTLLRNHNLDAARYLEGRLGDVLPDDPDDPDA